MDKESIREDSSMRNWYPKLQDTNVPTPYTVWVETEPEKIDEGTINEVTVRLPQINELRDAVKEVGGPDAFLRSDQASDKHGMDSASRIRRLDDSELRSTSISLGTNHLMKGIGGLGYEYMAVREWLELNFEFTAFEGLPIASELRFFIHDGEVVSSGFYWPTEAIRRPDSESWEQELESLREHALDAADGYVKQLAELVADEFDTGYWSVDFAETANGDWYCIDMARGEASWHPDGCEKPESLSTAD